MVPRQELTAKEELIAQQTETIQVHVVQQIFQSAMHTSKCFALCTDLFHS